MSLKLIREIGLTFNSPIIDIGGGASTLIDFLLSDGFTDLTVIDLSKRALDFSKQRLKERALIVNWIEGDVTIFHDQCKYQLWHDRAVFHFLVSESDQNRYLEVLNSVLKIGGHFIISTFAEDGPEKCSGLEIVRYSQHELINRVGQNFECKKFEKEVHISPGGLEQKFNYWLFQKKKNNCQIN